jgi:hypothetical protein
MQRTPTQIVGRGSVSVQRRYVDERQLAEYSGLSVKTLQRWRLYPDQGPPWRKFGGAVRYDIAQFDSWAERGPGGGQS